MNFKHTTALLALSACLATPSWADKVTRSVDNQGVPKITIHGTEKAARPAEAPVAPPKEFQVYELDGPGVPAPAAETPQVVIVPPPPPIAPNPAAFGYGYGYGFGFDYGFGYPGFGYPSYGYPGYSANCYPGSAYLPALNYQNPPVNYQNPPVNYQPRPLAPPYTGPRPYRR